MGEAAGAAADVFWPGAEQVMEKGSPNPGGEPTGARNQLEGMAPGPG